MLAAEWDALAESRLDQLVRGQDVSFSHILSPTIQRLLGEDDGDSLLDVGCGIGFLTAQLAQKFGRVVAIDPSVHSIELARIFAKSQGNIRFEPVSVEEFSSEDDRFSVIMANMTLMDVSDLAAALRAMARLGRGGGRLIFSITHPFFWPAYWGYVDADWFVYSEEIYIEAEFRIANASTGLLTTHVHRPLQAYVESVIEAGFSISQILEPIAPAAVQSVYRDGWGRVPRFLIFDCRLSL